MPGEADHLDPRDHLDHLDPRDILELGPHPADHLEHHPGAGLLEHGHCIAVGDTLQTVAINSQQPVSTLKLAILPGRGLRDHKEDVHRLGAPVASWLSPAHNGEAPARSVPPVKDDSFGILQLSGKFLPKHPTRNKIGRPKTGLWPLHDDQGHAAEADGGLEGGHGLGVGQTIQTGIVHPQQQVSLLHLLGFADTAMGMDIGDVYRGVALI